MNDDDTLSILVATDNHLGYLERDPIRGQDSFEAFSEILQLAQIHKVDMVLLGGDMFHDNKPSRKCLHQTLSLLRQYCLGDKPISIEYLSDPEVDFGKQFPWVNYEDPNMNISLPVFSIHGNHDDPSGAGNLSAMDMLAVSGLVNYFGKQQEVENIRVSPILLKKGKTRLALFGLGNVRDERLHRTIAKKRMTMCQPVEDTEKWFNLMVLHQNRVAHGPKNHIPEHFLNRFLDLVIWGHEHQCQVDPEFNTQQSFYVSQPGSSVATALSSGEAVDKHVAILKVNQRNFKIDKVRLKNVRPFIIEDVVLSQVTSLSPQSTEDEIVEFLRLKVESMISKAQEKYYRQVEDGHSQITPALGDDPKPLIRVRVEYSGGFESFHPQRFGLLFADRVANPKDVVYFYRKARPSASLATTSASKGMDVEHGLSDGFVVPPAPLEAVRVESLINEFLDDSSMQMLVDLELAEAIRLFVQKGDNDAINQSLKTSIDHTQRQILSQQQQQDRSGNGSQVIDETSLDERITQVRSSRKKEAIEKGLGSLESTNGDANLTVQLAAKKSAINVADRKAIKAFERIAVNAANALAASQKSIGSGNGNSNGEGEGEEFESESDQEHLQDDNDLRGAGQELNATKGRTTRKTATTATGSKSLSLSLGKRGRGAAASRNKRAASESESEQEEDNGDDDDDSDNGGDLNSSDFDGSAANATQKTKSAIAQISRPSRTARSTLNSRSNSVLSVASSTNDDDNENDDEEESTQSVPKTRRITASTRATRASGAATALENNNSNIEHSIDSLPVPKKQRVGSSATTGTTARGRGRGRGRGRARGRARGSTRATGTAGRLEFTQQQSLATNKSQLPTISIDDSDDEDSGGRGFGKFSLRRK